MYSSTLPSTSALDGGGCPLYHLDGIIEKVGEDFLLLDCGDVMAFEHDKVIVAIPFYSIAFIEEN